MLRRGSRNGEGAGECPGGDGLEKTCLSWGWCRPEGPGQPASCVGSLEGDLEPKSSVAVPGSAPGSGGLRLELGQWGEARDEG